MDQDLLKTSTKQRVIIAVIAILMLGSMIASYAAIVMGKNNSSTSSSSDPLIAKYEGPYTEAVRKVESATKGYFNDFVGYKGEVVAYTEVTANSEESALKRVLKNMNKEEEKQFKKKFG